MGENDLIVRCKGCSYCPIEDMLTEDQRRRNVLSDPIPERHIHREVVEQICQQQYDGVCEMKYVLERLSCDDRVGVQNAAVGISLWDLGKKYGREVRFPEGFTEWNVRKDMGRRFKESHAGRFKEVWDRGLRKTRQTLTILGIYERVVSKSYAEQVHALDALKRESEARHEGTLNI